MDDFRSIAILGASGQIGMGLVQAFASDARLSLFGRDPGRVRQMAAAHGLVDKLDHIGSMAEFSDGTYDAVINAAGPGDPARHRAAGADIASLTERLDRLVLDYLDDHPAAGYVYISTGAVYGPSYDVPATDKTPLCPPAAAGQPENLYARAKLAAETRHRARAGARIADIRLFGYVSPGIDPDGGYLLSRMLRCLIDDAPFRSGGSDFVRDYVGPRELAGLIRLILAAGTPNQAFDMQSAEPVTKYELINGLIDALGLKFERTDPHMEYIDKAKPLRVSLRSCSDDIGYLAARSSLRVVIDELTSALARQS